MPPLCLFFFLMWQRSKKGGEKINRPMFLRLQLEVRDQPTLLLHIQGWWLLSGSNKYPSQRLRARRRHTKVLFRVDVQAKD
jgi:hypothetical protein